MSHDLDESIGTPAMAYSKPWRSVADQLAQLRARGMQIGNSAGACTVLESRRGANASYQKS